MSIVEATTSMLETMPESDVQIVYSLTKDLFEKSNSPFKPLTREQILSDLAESREQIKNGEYLDFDDAIKEIRTAHGL